MSAHSIPSQVLAWWEQTLLTYISAVKKN